MIPGDYIISISRWFRRIFYRLVTAGTAEVRDEEAVTRIIMVNRLSLAFGVIILLIAPTMLYFLHVPRSILIPISIEFILNAAVIWLNHKRKPVSASLLLYFLQCCAIVYFSFLMGQLLQLQFTIVFLLSIIYLIFKEPWQRRLAFIAALVVLALIETAYYLKEEEAVLEISAGMAYAIHVMVVVAVLFIIIVVSKPYIKSNDINAELKRANDLKRVFVYQVIHEMRTPLNAIYGIAQLMKKELKLDENLKPIEPLTNQLLAATNNARRIIGDVLDMARIESGNIESSSENSFLVKPFFINLVEMNRVVALSRQMELKLEIEDMPEVIVGDSLKLIQVTTNLLANAIKYGDKGSEVTIRITGHAPTWDIAVINNGPAIPPDKLPQIFDPFMTDKDRYTEGTGLGLYIVKNKVEAMGGTIGVRSEEGQPTVFTTTLPLEEGRREDLVKEDLSQEIADLSNINVAIAEDNELNAVLLKRMLIQIGCEVTVATNGLELLHDIDKRKPDVVIMDNHMDVMNGAETLQRLKSDARFSQIPVIVATGDADRRSHEALKAAGANAIVEKPIDHKTLHRLLKKMLHRDGDHPPAAL